MSRKWLVDSGACSHLSRMKRIVKRNPVTTYAKLLSCGGRKSPREGMGQLWLVVAYHTPRVFQRDLHVRKPPSKNMSARKILYCF
jgi:hypothetical protein